MKLWMFEDKRVRLTDVDGKIFVGFVDHYTSELDSPNDIASISLELDGRDDVCINFEESEIACIEVFAANAQAMAMVV